jgi:hypothetical protein
MSKLSFRVQWSTNSVQSSKSLNSKISKIYRIYPSSLTLVLREEFHFSAKVKKNMLTKVLQFCWNNSLSKNLDIKESIHAKEVSFSLSIIKSAILHCR